LRANKRWRNFSTDKKKTPEHEVPAMDGRGMESVARRFFKGLIRLEPAVPRSREVRPRFPDQHFPSDSARPVTAARVLRAASRGAVASDGSRRCALSVFPAAAGRRPIVRVLAGVVAAGLLCAGPSIGAAPSARTDHVASVAELWARAETQQRVGALSQAARTLRAARERAGSPAQASGTALRLAAVAAGMGDIDEAQRQLTAAGDAAALSASDRVLRTTVEAALATRAGDYAAAERHYARAAEESRAAGSPIEAQRADANAQRARLDARQIEGLESRLAALQKDTQALAPGDDAAALLLAVAELHRRAVAEFRSPDSLIEVAYQDATRARDIAAGAATRAQALGFLGHLYESAGRWDEAARLTSQALFLAQSVAADDQRFRWEWQLGRIERARGSMPGSAAALEQALTTLADIRSDVLKSSPQAFSKLVEPAYLDYADTNLQRAAALPAGGDEQQKILRAVRDRLETLKQAEVEDYFQNECVASQESPSGSAFDLPGVAVVYPILLGDRMETLIEAGGSLRRFSAPVSRGEATVTARRLRLGLEQPSSGDVYLEPAQALYRWMLAEAAPWLAERQVNTLVFVPSGPLRTVPLGVLHDGQGFLLERFAVATTPAVSLVTSLRPGQVDRMLVAGLTESVQGFAQLPNVAQEVRAVSAMFPSQALQDATFRLAAVETDLSSKQYSVAHLATHGEFNADRRRSFVLTYDDRLTMDRLQTSLSRRRDQPLDLLVLSACRTAAGDDRAALGLAGVAVQAGARTAVASLWYVSDAATANLMQRFYQNMKSGGGSKAQSLRAAQLALLQSAEFRHPSYWAPYLLIGNWM